VPQTVNEQILDSFAEHDIDLRKLDGDIRNKVDRILVELGKDLKVLLVRIDPHGATRLDARKRRTKRLREEARPLISDAYVRIGRLVRHDLRRLSKVESKAANRIVRDAIP